MVGIFPDPHDLLWGFTAQHLPADAPAWCKGAIQGGFPVVVRRAPLRSGCIAVGLRGRQRGERFAGWLPLSAITRVLRPEALTDEAPGMPASLPVWEALAIARSLLDHCGLVWGVTGSAGFQLACGQSVVHAGSDLDLLLRTPHPLDRAKARQLMDDLGRAPCRIDMQLQTPCGGVALAEWACASGRVMVKTTHEPLLLADPWEVTPS